MKRNIKPLRKQPPRWVLPVIFGAIFTLIGAAAYLIVTEFISFPVF